jgi:hypothetical protein
MLMDAWWNVYSVADIRKTYAPPMLTVKLYLESFPAAQFQLKRLAACAPATSGARRRWEARETPDDFFDLMGWAPDVDRDECMTLFFQLGKMILGTHHRMNEWMDVYASYKPQALCDLRDAAIVTELLLVAFPDSMGFGPRRSDDERFICIGGTLFHRMMKDVKHLPPPLRAPEPVLLSEPRRIGDAIENVFACAEIYQQNAAMREELYGYLAWRERTSSRGAIVSNHKGTPWTEIMRPIRSDQIRSRFYRYMGWVSKTEAASAGKQFEELANKLCWKRYNHVGWTHTFQSQDTSGCEDIRDVAIVVTLYQECQNDDAYFSRFDKRGSIGVSIESNRRIDKHLQHTDSHRWKHRYRSGDPFRRRPS